MKYQGNYAGIEDEYAGEANAAIVLIPVPYDGTSTWQKGADKGPDAFLEASANMELYDIETDTEVYRRGVYLAPAVEEDSSPEAMVDAVEEAVGRYLDAGKFVTAFGGEHSISIGVIRAFSKRYENLSVLQIDAHADLRESYEGSRCNHACAVYEARYNTNLVQVGIRSMDVSEKAVMVEDNVFFAHHLRNNPQWMDQALGRLGEKVFITIDLDAFDPSIMPSTGTPEPGGLLWYETLDFLRSVAEHREIVGFDIVELCPREEERSSDFLAAKLYYKLLTYIFEKK